MVKYDDQTQNWCEHRNEIFSNLIKSIKGNAYIVLVIETKWALIRYLSWSYCISLLKQPEQQQAQEISYKKQIVKKDYDELLFNFIYF